MTNGIHAPFQTSSKTADVIYAATYSRGGDATRDVFEKKMSRAVASGDAELMATYDIYKKKLDF